VGCWVGGLMRNYLNKEWKVYAVKEYCFTCGGAAKLLSASIVPKWCTNYVYSSKIVSSTRFLLYETRMASAAVLHLRDAFAPCYV
jgi:hypothetical protein